MRATWDALGNDRVTRADGLRRNEAKCPRPSIRRTRTCGIALQQVDAEIRRIIDEQYTLARGLIEGNRDKIEAMAKALLEWETLDAEQINDIMEGRSPRPPKPATPPAQHPPRDSSPTPTPTTTAAPEA